MSTAAKVALDGIEVALKTIDKAREQDDAEKLRTLGMLRVHLARVQWLVQDALRLDEPMGGVHIDVEGVGHILTGCTRGTSRDAMRALQLRAQGLPHAFPAGVTCMEA